MLAEEEIQKIINQFDKEELNKNGFLGIFHYGGGSSESFIKANKEGLQLFALELLKATKHKSNDNFSEFDSKGEIINLEDDNWFDVNSHIHLHYIELVKERQESNIKSNYKSSFKNKLSDFGCMLTVLIIAISVIVGLVTLFKLLF